MRTIDYRSDTKSLPTPEMRRAMAEAELGDDVAGEDPTVNRLEAMAAEMLGKEAAVLVSSGTQGNLISILAQCQRGDEIIIGAILTQTAAWRNVEQALANLRGADLAGANLDWARASADTVWPEGFSPRSAGVKNSRGYLPSVW